MEAADGALQTQIARLAAGGLNQTQIAERVGIAQSTVSRIMVRVRQTWRADTAASYENLLAREYAYLEHLRSCLADGVTNGSTRHIEQALRLSERVSRQLGLDHADRMNERRVQLEEAQQQIAVAALVKVLDHLELTGEAREEAITVLRGELEQEQRL